MRSDRLLSLLLLLQAHGRLPAPELARRLEVSVRTVLRDVEALSAAGIPVYTERGRHGGIALLPGFRTDVTGMTADEARALFVMLTGSTHASLGLGAAVGSALRKIMAALPAPHREAADLVARRIIVDPVRWRTAAAPAAGLSTLQEAVFTDRRLRLRYRSGDAPAPTDRIVDPYGLVEKAGVWYLVADRDGHPRLYRADRVVAAELLDQPVRRRTTTLADEWSRLRARVEDFPGGLTVRVLVKAASLARFTLLHRAELVSPPPSANDSPSPHLDGDRPVSSSPQLDGAGSVSPSPHADAPQADGAGSVSPSPQADAPQADGAGPVSPSPHADAPQADGAGPVSPSPHADGDGPASSSPHADGAEPAASHADSERPVLLELRFATVTAARTLLAFGTDVRVLSPASVLADLAAVSAATAAHYASPAEPGNG
ncbi:WYL domain-containing protein [Catenuloplanes atrovinosus]|uniref:DNA-binding transcriptional regulator YafY n=1 Tax=Catenuloplanes atrovinosus TaxID=137266 RepID=A0AAE3YT80_9ACTN|nr:WYL domain-containing protein [Catenuloplanes atrovinosus]MDR7277446.1 putative DNA-binding transcriptional regulator YafY [Catenuloplanes atrovinosus]